MPSGLRDVGEVQRVRRRWLNKRDRVHRVYDYYEKPKPSGYRGIHLIVEYDDRLIEVQLRTRFQHAWGISIERVGPRLGVDLKSGEGPADVLHLYRLFGELIAMAEGLPSWDLDFDELQTTADAVGPETMSLVGLAVTDHDVTIDMPPLRGGR